MTDTTAAPDQTSGSTIGPLTAEEWCAFRMRDDDNDILRCCANTSELRTAIFYVLRQGGGWEHGQGLFRQAWETFIDTHPLDDLGETEQVLLAKLRDFYLTDTPPWARPLNSAAPNQG